MSDWKDCKKMDDIRKIAESAIDQGDFNKAVFDVLSTMKKSECTKPLVDASHFILCKLILSEHQNNKEIFIENLLGFCCTCKCEKSTI